MKQIYILLLGLAVASAEKPPYPPSGWKPEGARLVLPRQQQDSYGPPPPPPDYGYPSSSQPASGYGPPPSAPPSSGYGPPAPTPPLDYGPPQNDSKTPNPEQEDLDKVNEQIMARLRQQKGSDTGVYYVYLPDGRLQRVQYTTAPLKASKQEAFDQRGPDGYQQNSFKQQQGTFSSQQQSFGNFARQQTSYDAPPYPPSAPAASQPSEQFNSASFNSNNQAVDIPGDPSHLFARYDSASNTRASSSSKKVSSQSDGEQPPAKYVASVSFTDVAPINGPIYSFNNQPLVRVVRYASMFQ